MLASSFFLFFFPVVVFILLHNFLSYALIEVGQFSLATFNCSIVLNSSNELG